MPQVPSLALNVGGSVVPISPRQCGLRAMDALVATEQFPFATIQDDGSVLGWNDMTSVLVLTFPTQEGATLYMVVAVGRNSKEADRIRNTVRDRICAPSDAPPSTPTLVHDESALESKAPWIHHEANLRPVISTLKYYQPVVSLLLEKRGFQVFNANNNLMLGGDHNRVVAAFAVPGKNAVTTNFGVVVADEDRAAADRFCQQFYASVSKLIYE